MLNKDFFNDDAVLVAKKMLGKLICHRVDGVFRKVRIIETEAYYKSERASHASLGYTYSRRALFMPAGTIYMYHSRGGDSFNITTEGEGNAVLIKSAIAYLDNPEPILNLMLEENPIISRKDNSSRYRDKERLCSGQVLLCKSLKLKRADWNAKDFDKSVLFIDDINYNVKEIIARKRLGISTGRDEDLALRFIDASFLKSITRA